MEFVAKELMPITSLKRHLINPMFSTVFAASYAARQHYNVADARNSSGGS